ncbi:MAG: polysaccharide biosynthesis protein [Deltaproteobacteria bacterium]|nr:polysaccharide biosynthesis protein [Deltaproteobacteria bacterium]
MSILGGREEIPRILERTKVDEIIITSPTMRPKELKDLMNRFREADVRFKIIPPMSDIINESVSIKQLRDVSVEDLLGRKTVRLDEDLIREHLEGRVVLITGAGGTIGAELARQIAKMDPEELILFERNENNLFMTEWELATRFPHVRLMPVIGDIMDREGLDRVMRQFRPAVVFHSAAYKHVPMMERHPASAVQNNVIGTLNCALASVEAGVERFVFISTDKAVRPTNVMGMTKRVGELILQSLSSKGTGTKFIAVRFGNVMGSAGSVIPLFQRQIAEGGPVTVTHPKARRYFMTIREAAQLVMQAAAMGAGGEIFVLEMGEQILILDLARNLIRLSGLEPERDIEVKFIGLRPGEKLAEELYASKEGVEPTRHDKIFALPPQQPSPAHDFDARLKELIQLTDQGDIGAALAVMTTLTRDEGAGEETPPRPPSVLH